MAVRLKKNRKSAYILRSHDLIEAGKVDEAIKDLVTAIKSARDDETESKGLGHARRSPYC